MIRASEILDLEVHGYGEIGWGTRLDELLPWFSEGSILRREAHPSHPEFAFDQCAGRAAILSTTGSVCGADAELKLNFCEGKLCAVHCYFRSAAGLDDHDYCQIVDGICRRMSATLGEPHLRTKLMGDSDASFRWTEAGLHVELRAFAAPGREMMLAANDPSICDWCLTPK